MLVYICTSVSPNLPICQYVKNTLSALPAWQTWLGLVPCAWIYEIRALSVTQTCMYSCMLMIMCIASCSLFSSSHWVLSPLFFFQEDRWCVTLCLWPNQATFCQKHTDPQFNLCSHKLPEQLLLSGPIPGSSGMSFLPVPSLPLTPCRAWSMDGKLTHDSYFLKGPDFSPYSTGLVSAGKSRNGYYGFFLLSFQNGKRGEKKSRKERGRERDRNCSETERTKWESHVERWYLRSK